ncbi:hypothetical protein ACFVAQ_36075 [Streptomyces sp. NPDC057651]|uniref:hypothetical protein n=1 Tax=Streptomyces sp. NPDC057651 TaxID=3346194 RepID=UPI0036847C3D
MKVLRGLGLPEDDSRAFVLIDGTEFLISVFDEPPLSPKFPATRELLTPHPKTGMHVSGFSITGQPVHNFVFQHDKNAAKHGLVLGVTRGGKTQFFAVTMVAESNAGQIVWLSSCFKDEKTATLVEHIDRQGISPIYMARQLRAAMALCQIRAEMPWAYDGKPHDYKPGDDRCPYKQLNVYADEFMTASQDPTFGDFIQADGDALTVMGLKYGIGFNPAGQSPFAHNGFSTEMKDNLRQNSRPVIFNMGSPGATRKAAEGTMENAYDVPTIPARYAPKEGSTIERAMAGEAEPENGVSTGGVAVVVLDNGRAILMKALYVDFDEDLADLFPSEINRLTDHEISELDKLGLWGGWNRPPARPRRVVARARRGQRRRRRRTRAQVHQQARSGHLRAPGPRGHPQPHRRLSDPPHSPNPQQPGHSPTSGRAAAHHKETQRCGRIPVPHRPNRRNAVHEVTE